MSLTIWVPGRPVPQGSATIQRFNTAHRGMVVSSNKDRLLPWRAAVAGTVSAAWLGDALTVPVVVSLDFRFARPKSHFGTGARASIVKASAPGVPSGRGQGDVDKLSRAVLDALTDGGVIADDSLVVSLVAGKSWAGRQGVYITVNQLGAGKTRRGTVAA